MLLVIDNYDSFVYNLARYFEQLRQPTLVVRNDCIDVQQIRWIAPQAIVLSPGPCTPNEAGCCLELIRELHRELPILGVCLGHQAIAAAFGGRVVCSGNPIHGRSSAVFHDNGPLFDGVPHRFRAGRYHSLIVEEATLPQELEVLARGRDGVVMAIGHRSLPVYGVQFHPESVLTEHGYRILANFLRLAGMAGPHALPEEGSIAEQDAACTLPTAAHPITF